MISNVHIEVQPLQCGHFHPFVSITVNIQLIPMENHAFRSKLLPTSLYIELQKLCFLIIVQNVCHWIFHLINALLHCNVKKIENPHYGISTPVMLYCVQLLFVFLLWRGCVIYQTLESNWTKVVLDLDMSIWFNI